MYSVLNKKELLDAFFRLVENGQVDKKTLSKCTRLNDKESIDRYGFETISVPKDLYEKIQKDVE